MIDALGLYLLCGVVFATGYLWIEDELDLDLVEVPLFLVRVTLAWPTYVLEELYLMRRTELDE